MRYCGKKMGSIPQDSVSGYTLNKFVDFSRCQDGATVGLKERTKLEVFFASRANKVKNGFDC